MVAPVTATADATLADRADAAWMSQAGWFDRAMGYRGKLDAQDRARELRASGMTLADIAERLGVAKSSVSVWVRDVDFTPSPRRTGAQRRPNRLRDRKLAEIAALDAAGIERIGVLTDDAFLAAGVALYAGEGSKGDGAVKFANTDPGRKPYRATPDASIRRNKHEHGCAYVSYCCSRTHREVMGMVRALLSPGSIRGSSIGRAAGC